MDARLLEEDYTTEKVKLSTWKEIFKVLLLEKKTLIIMLAAIVVLAGLDICYPLFNSYAMERYFNNDLPMSRFDNVWFFIGLYVLVAVGYLVSILVFLLFASKLQALTAYNLRKKAFARLQELPFSYFDATPSGWIMARMTSDSRRLAEILSWGLLDALWGVLSMFFILIALLIKNPLLAIILVIITPIIAVVTYFLRKKILKAHRDARKENSKITASYNEGFMGSKTTKSLVIEKNNSEEFYSLAVKLRHSSIRAVLFSAIFGPIVWLIGYLGVATTLYTGGIMVINNSINAATLYLFIEFTLRFLDPVTVLANTLAEFQQAQASAERIVSLITTVPQILDTEDVIAKYGTSFEPKRENWEMLQGDIEFKDVTFKYNEGETVLRNFNLKIKKGQTVALVGHTGSGKSTVVNLICRFYEPTEGSILIDGVDYKKRSVGWLHANLGYVLQSPQLFSGSIMENIRYGRRGASDEEVIEAAKTINAHDFIINLEKGYQTDVGESGNKLSLGEKQLISFARALLADPRILVLDEATSSIDTETESLIQKAIGSVLEGRTNFLIAHRLSTVVNADVILVMRSGEIVEQGSHAELLDNRGYYFDLYKTQFLKEIELKLMS